MKKDAKVPIKGAFFVRNICMKHMGSQRLAIAMLISMFSLYSCTQDIDGVPPFTFLSLLNNGQSSTTASPAAPQISSIAPFPYSILLQNQSVILVFDQSLDNGTCTVTPGTLTNPGTPTYSTTTIANDTLTIPPGGGSWVDVGSNKNMTVSGCSSSGLTGNSYNLVYFVANPGRTYYIDANNGNDGYTGGSFDPFQTLSMANTALGGSNCSANKDCAVLIATGVYPQPTPFIPLDGVAYTGSYDAAFTSTHYFSPGYQSTVADGSAAGGGATSTPGRAIEVNNTVTSSTVISGLAIAGRAVNYSSAVLVNGGSPIFVANFLVGGGGAAVVWSTGATITSGSPRFLTNLIWGHNSSAPAPAASLGIYQASGAGDTATYVANYIDSGTALTANGSIQVVSGAAIFANNIAWTENSNASSYGVIHSSSNGNSVYQNNSFYIGDNAILTATGLEYSATAGNLSFENNIVYFATNAVTRTGFSEASTGSPISFRNNDIYGSTILYHDSGGSDFDTLCSGVPGLSGCGSTLTSPGAGMNNGNLNENPQFAVLTTLITDIDLHLTASTPCTVARGGLTIGSIVNDREGNARPGSDGFYSIGAYEPTAGCF